MNTPSTAKTSSSSVSAVHTSSGSACSDRLVDLVDGFDLPPEDAAVVVDVVDEDLRGLLLVAAVEVDELAMHA